MVWCLVSRCVFLIGQEERSYKLSELTERLGTEMFIIKKTNKPETQPYYKKKTPLNKVNMSTLKSR